MNNDQQQQAPQFAPQMAPTQAALKQPASPAANDEVAQVAQLGYN